MAANMYRVGDYVYFETSATAPYQIRRIEELTKTPTGNVEAKVMCYYRRRDMSNTLINQVDKHLNTDEDSSTEAASAENGAAKPDESGANAWTNGGGAGSGMTEAQRHQLKHRELFLSRQIETLPATTIRGKCSVTLYNEAEVLAAYLSREDAFYYTLVFDNSQKTLLNDRGEIRVGQRYQAEVQPLLADGQSDGRDLAQLEELTWRPDNGLAAGDIDKYLLVARSVGTLARAVDACSAIRQPGLAPAAAAASRDVTQAHAYRLLHAADYDLGRAFCRLVTDGGPILCRDQLEDWSAGEAALFEEGMDKYGKDFEEIRRDHLPWKSMRAIVEYFYMWKTTDRYVQRKRLKASEAERKLKQVYIPNYTKPNPAVLYNAAGSAGAASRPCESCHGAATTGGQWYAWGPPHLACRLCTACWAYWKRYGGLKSPTRLEKAASPGPAVATATAASAPARVHRCPVSGCDKDFRLRPLLVRHLAADHKLDEASLGQLQQQQLLQAQTGNSKAKSVKSMLMQANVTTRLARLLCPDLLRTRRLARRPFDARFDPRQALRDLPKRLKASGRTPKQLLPGGGVSQEAKRRRLLRRRLTPAELDDLLRRLCPDLLPAGAGGDSSQQQLPDFLAKTPGPKAAPLRRTFPLCDSASRAAFFNRLDEEQHKRQAPTTTNGNGISASAGANHNKGSDDDSGKHAAEKLPNGTAAAPSVTAAAAAAAAEEIFLCDTKRFRAHMTTVQVRRAGRRPFRPLAAAAASAAGAGAALAKHSVTNGNNSGGGVGEESEASSRTVKPAVAAVSAAAVSAPAKSPVHATAPALKA